MKVRCITKLRVAEAELSEFFVNHCCVFFASLGMNAICRCRDLMMDSMHNKEDRETLENLV